MISQSLLEESIIDNRSYRGAKTGNFHRLDNLIVRIKILTKLKTRMSEAIVQLSKSELAVKARISGNPGCFKEM